jgi:SAM-dependent methyltransferase
VRSIAILFLRAIRKILRVALSAANSGIRSLSVHPGNASELLDDAKLKQVRQFLFSLDQPNAQSRDYIHVHADRLAATVVFAPPARTSRRCLELGSYMHIAPALKEFSGYDQVRVASLGPAGTTITKVASSQGREILRCNLDLFDVEQDTFPYPDEHFELVLACELLEHLRTDPMHMWFEIYRVLQHEGRILLSTPNCASISSLEQCLWRSANPYTYSLYPNPQRPDRDDAASHIREYTPDEVGRLLEAAGFRVEVLITRPGRVVESKGLIEDLLLAYGFPTDLRGEQIYCVARKAPNGGRVRFPEFLYG